MSDKFQDIYRILSARAEWWDYRNDAAYFVTICTAGREHYFGEIAETCSVETLHATSLSAIAPGFANQTKQEMQLSGMGQIAYQHWMEIPNHFSFIKLDAFVVMPNHIHGILAIDHCVESPTVEMLRDSVETLHATSLQQPDQPIIKNEEMASISPKSGSLSSVIRSYKSVVSKNCRAIHSDFGWQTRFHDHIIRDEIEFWKIREYILNNPNRWSDDKYNQQESF